LMPADQLTKGVLVVVEKNSRDEIGIGELHIAKITGLAAAAESRSFFRPRVSTPAGNPDR
jgi:hypothetical protein